MSSFEMLGVFTPHQKSLIRGWWKKVTAAHPSARKFKDMKIPTVENGVFGVPLVESIKYARSSISYIDDLTGKQCFGVIPTVVAKCGSFLKNEAMAVEGIFRVSGSAKRMRMLQSVFDTPISYGSQLDWRGYNVHDAANMLKRFLNFLPEPVITLEYYQILKDTANMEYVNLDHKIAAIQSVIECLPVAHQYLLLYLLDMLSMFVTTQEYTKMSTASLASIFAPGLLSHPNDVLNPASYIESQRILTFLIEHHERFSMPRVNTMSEQSSVQPPSTKEAFEGGGTGRFKHSDESHGGSTIYTLAAGSYSGSGIESIMEADDLICPLPSSSQSNPAPLLRRSKTLPSRRCRYGLHDPTQVVHVNRTSSQRVIRRKDRLIFN